MYWDMYQDDSFFTLGLLEAAGVLVVSALLALGLLVVARRLYRGGRPGRRLLWAAALFWVFLWLSPQVYYIYYQLIFHGLPVQIVIGWPPGAETVLRRLVFVGPATLAAHGQGVDEVCEVGLAGNSDLDEAELFLVVVEAVCFGIEGDDGFGKQFWNECLQVFFIIDDLKIGQEAIQS